MVLKKTKQKKSWMPARIKAWVDTLLECKQIALNSHKKLYPQLWKQKWHKSRLKSFDSVQIDVAQSQKICVRMYEWICQDTPFERYHRSATKRARQLAESEHAPKALCRLSFRLTFSNVYLNKCEFSAFCIFL